MCWICYDLRLTIPKMTLRRSGSIFQMIMKFIQHPLLNFTINPITLHTLLTHITLQRINMILLLNINIFIHIRHRLLESSLRIKFRIGIEEYMLAWSFLCWGFLLFLGLACLVHVILYNLYLGDVTLIHKDKYELIIYYWSNLSTFNKYVKRSTNGNSCSHL